MRSYGEEEKYYHCVVLCRPVYDVKLVRLCSLSTHLCHLLLFLSSLLFLRIYYLCVSCPDIFVAHTLCSCWLMLVDGTVAMLGQRAIGRVAISAAARVVRNRGKIAEMCLSNPTRFFSPYLSGRSLSNNASSSPEKTKNGQKKGPIPGNLGMDHIGLVVPNVQVVANFLIDVFGCKFDWEVKRESTPTAGERFIEHKLGPRTWSDLFNVDPAAYMPHVMMLRAGPDEHKLAQYIELFEWSSPNQNKEWPRFSDVGHSYVSFTVMDVKAVMAHIKSFNIAGLRFIQDPPMEFAMRDEVCTSTFCVTPWGFWIEITEWSKSKHTGHLMSATQSSVASKFAATATGANDNHRAAVKHPDIGKNIFECDTPCVFVDLDAVEHNCRLMSARFKAKNVFWRPPVKAHKCPQLAQLLVREGAGGILTLKVSEAEEFADWGFDNITIANQVVGASGIARLVALAKRVLKLRVQVDDEENLRAIHAAMVAGGARIEVLVELNVNHDRCGVTPVQAVQLVEECVRLQKEQQRKQAAMDGVQEDEVMGVLGVKYAGIHGYEGHTPVLPPAQKTAATVASHAILAETKKLLTAKGLAPKHVTVRPFFLFVLFSFISAFPVVVVGICFVSLSSSSICLSLVLPLLPSLSRLLS